MAAIQLDRKRHNILEKINLNQKKMLLLLAVFIGVTVLISLFAILTVNRNVEYDVYHPKSDESLKSLVFSKSSNTGVESYNYDDGAFLYTKTRKGKSNTQEKNANDEQIKKIEKIARRYSFGSKATHEKCAKNASDCERIKITVVYEHSADEDTKNNGLKYIVDSDRRGAANALESFFKEIFK